MYHLMVIHALLGVVKKRPMYIRNSGSKFHLHMLVHVGKFNVVSIIVIHVLVYKQNHHYWQD